MNLPNKLTMLRVILVPVFMVFAAFFAAFFILRFLEDDLAAVDITAAAVPTARLTPTVFIAEFILLFIIFSSVL